MDFELSSPYRFAYRDHGDPEQPCLLFMHGFMGDKHDWDDITPSFRRDYRTLAIDLPGHGETTVPDDSLYRMEHCAAGLISLLQNLGIGDCSVIGYSMGGRLAVYLAAAFPQRFSSFILESTSPGLKTAEERRVRREHDEALARRLEDGDFSDFLQEWYQQPLFSSLSSDRSTLESIIKKRLQNDPARLARSLRMMGTGTQPPVWERLGKITAPVLMLSGGLDAKFSGIATEVTRLCRSAKSHIISGCGHNVHAENPAAFVKACRRFLSENKQGK